MHNGSGPPGTSVQIYYPKTNSREGEENTNPIKERVQAEKQKLLSEGHIKKLDKCTSGCFIEPIVIAVEKDDSIKLASNAKPIIRRLFKNK